MVALLSRGGAPNLQRRQNGGGHDRGGLTTATVHDMAVVVRASGGRRRLEQQRGHPASHCRCRGRWWCCKGAHSVRAHAILRAEKAPAAGLSGGCMARGAGCAGVVVDGKWQFPRREMAACCKWAVVVYDDEGRQGPLPDAMRHVTGERLAMWALPSAGGNYGGMVCNGGGRRDALCAVRGGGGISLEIGVDSKWHWIRRRWGQRRPSSPFYPPGELCGWTWAMCG